MCVRVTEKSLKKDSWTSSSWVLRMFHLKKGWEVKHLQEPRRSPVVFIQPENLHQRVRITRQRLKKWKLLSQAAHTRPVLIFMNRWMKIMERRYKSCSWKELWDRMSSFSLTKDGFLKEIMKEALELLSLVFWSSNGSDHGCCSHTSRSVWIYINPAEFPIKLLSFT